MGRKELDKAYDPNNPEDDPKERDEDEKDPGWDSLEDEELYTDEEFQRFEQEREESYKKMIENGQLPPAYPYPNIPGMPPAGYGHPQFGNYGPIPGGPMPGLSANGVPMHGSVPGQPANQNFAPDPRFAQQQPYMGQPPPQYVGQQQFAQPQQFAGQ